MIKKVYMQENTKFDIVHSILEEIDIDIEANNTWQCLANLILCKALEEINAWWQQGYEAINFSGKLTVVT